jgi:hypothetical protein
MLIIQSVVDFAVDKDPCGQRFSSFSRLRAAYFGEQVLRLPDYIGPAVSLCVNPVRLYICIDFLFQTLVHRRHFERIDKLKCLLQSQVNNDTFSCCPPFLIIGKPE